MESERHVPVLGLAAFSGTGKTTLLRQLIAYLARGGMRIGVVKHAHHDFDIDYPGKDSYELRKSGAYKTLVVSDVRWALVTELPQRRVVPLHRVLSCLDPSDVDLVLVEGYKHERFPKLELHRTALDKPYLYPDDDSIIAIATDRPDEITDPLQVMDINDVAQIAAFVSGFADNSKGLMMHAPQLGSRCADSGG